MAGVPYDSLWAWAHGCLFLAGVSHVRESSLLGESCWCGQAFGRDMSQTGSTVSSKPNSHVTLMLVEDGRQEVMCVPSLWKQFLAS